MFISPAYAQAAGAGGGDAFQAFLPLILIFIVFYFLLIRPQQKKMKQHRETLEGIRRGDKVVTGGGIIGTVTKVDNETELTVEIAKDVKVKVQRSTVSGVINRTDPVGGKAAANDTNDKPKSLLGSLFGGGQKKSSAPTAAEPESDQKDDVAGKDDASHDKAAKDADKKD
jgi:preprotein translocase subunit YajC|tara:strand:+ start:226 stop:735 length:510 start_codon:yes stop_codon:yes gene_type:complete